MEKVANKKRITLLVIAVMLIAVTCVCFVACNNSEDYEKRLKDNGYVTISMTEKQISDYVDVSVDEVEWAVMGVNGTDEFVCVIKFKNSNSAKDCEDEINAEPMDGFSVERNGKKVLFGTEQAVKDAK